jgi:hypothetical protein
MVKGMIKNDKFGMGIAYSHVAASRLHGGLTSRTWYQLPKEI